MRSEDNGNATGINGSGIRKPGITQVGILFSITVILFIFIGYRAQRNNFYSGVLITELGLILLPAFVFLLLFRYDLKKVLRLNGTRPLNFLLTFVLMLLAIPIAGVFNIANLFIINSIFGKVILNQPPAANDLGELLVNILLIAGSAGLCEEFLFRGVIQRGYERLGTVRPILLASFLFSLMHMDFQKIFGTFLLGALIGFIVYRTDSLYCGMFAHFSNNAVAVVASYVSTKLMSMLQGSGVRLSEETDLSNMFSAVSNLPPRQLLAMMFAYGFGFLILITAFILLLYALLKLNPVRKGEYPGVKNNAAGLIWILPGILLIAGIYYLEVFRFTGADNGIIEAARRLLGI